MQEPDELCGSLGRVGVAAQGFYFKGSRVVRWARKEVFEARMEE